MRDENKKVVEWLDNYLDENIDILLIRMDIMKIGDSMSVILNIVESPNYYQVRTDQVFLCVSVLKPFQPYSLPPKYGGLKLGLKNKKREPTDI